MSGKLVPPGRIIQRRSRAPIMAPVGRRSSQCWPATLKNESDAKPGPLYAKVGPVLRQTRAALRQTRAGLTPKSGRFYAKVGPV